MILCDRGFRYRRPIMRNIASSHRGTQVARNPGYDAHAEYPEGLDLSIVEGGDTEQGLSAQTACGVFILHLGASTLGCASRIEPLHGYRRLRCRLEQCQKPSKCHDNLREGMTGC